MIATRRPWTGILNALPQRTVFASRGSLQSAARKMTTSNSSSTSSQPPNQQKHQPLQSQSPPQQKPIYFGPFEVTNQVFLTTPYSFALVNLKPLLPGHVLVCPLAPHRRLTDLSPAELADLMVAVQRVQRMLARRYFSSSSSSLSSSPSPPASSSPPSPSSSSPIPSANANANANPTEQQQRHHQEQQTTPAAAEGGGPPATPEQGAFNIAVQDGPEAGQTVPHVHVHVIPRIRGATAKPAETPSDALYERMADEDGNVGGALWDRQTAVTMTMMKERPRPGGSFPSIEDASRRARSMAEMEEEAGVYRRLLAAMDEEEVEGR